MHKGTWLKIFIIIVVYIILAIVISFFAMHPCYNPDVFEKYLAILNSFTLLAFVMIFWKINKDKFRVKFVKSLLIFVALLIIFVALLQLNKHVIEKRRSNRWYEGCWTASPNSDLVDG